MSPIVITQDVMSSPASAASNSCRNTLHKGLQVIQKPTQMPYAVPEVVPQQEAHI